MLLAHFSIAVSNGNGSCEEFNHHTGLKFYNEDNKCLRAVSPQQVLALPDLLNSLNQQPMTNTDMLHRSKNHIISLHFVPKKPGFDAILK